MTKFTKENLVTEGKYLFYRPNGPNTLYRDRKFVCRFRTRGVGTFATHLRKRWTVEDYFAQLDAGGTPLGIVETTGYLLPHIKKELKQKGYPLTVAGKKRLINDEVEAWKTYRKI